MIDVQIPRQTVDQFVAIVERAERFVLTCHLSPDGDAIGSTLAMRRILLSLGKQATVVVPDQPAPALSGMPDAETIVVATIHRAEALKLIADAEVILCQDFNALSRVGDLRDPIEHAQATRVLIDHHRDPELQHFAVAFSYPPLSSTSELVYRLIHLCGWADKLDLNAATCLYAGLIFDTGNFAYSNGYPEVFEMAADLVRRGVDNMTVYNQILNTGSESALRLQGYALGSKLEIDHERGAALIALSAEELERFSYHKGDTEGLVNKPLSIPTVNLSVFLREDERCIKVSMRSQAPREVNGLCARYYNGGGHRYASGGEFHGSLKDAIEVYHQMLHDIENEQKQQAQ